jgi:hypothetical protein
MSQQLTLQGVLESRANLPQEVETTRTEREQLKLKTLSLQEQLDACLDSTAKDTQVRVGKIVNLKYETKRYQVKVIQTANLLQDASEREITALAEKDRYKKLALDLQGQLDQLYLPTSEPLLLQQSDTDLPTTSKALTRNLGDLASMTTDLRSHSTWTSSNSSDIIFIAVSRAVDGCARGFKCIV